MEIKIGIIGGGNMGGAIAAGLSKEYTVSVCELDKKRARELKKKYKVATGDLKTIAGKSNVIILAVKPQNMDELLKDLRPHLTSRSMVISIAAGITCRYIEKGLGPNARVIRTMPNLPVQTGAGMTAICPGKRVVSQDLILACRLFSCVGKSVVVKEKQMDAVTAVSGSGPAYIFLIIEHLEKAARSLGLSEAITRDLVQETLKGSLSLLEQSKVDAGTLRERVTSKGGTTQAALDVFSAHQLDRIFQKALSAAAKRAKELSK